MGRFSVATVSSPEFINITSISPFASKCEIKVFYLGQNRNGSFINKETATQMAQTLPGCPIVGYFSENKDDFRDHGEQVVIDGDGVKFKCQTVPYGFVAPDAKVWFKEFEDTDEFGNKTLRTYLMTEGYLWTEQYEEAQRVINEGRPQSMELDTNTLKGYWSTDNNSGMDFFIINDAIFSKLCILGEDVEPCFEGASVTAPDVSSNFSMNEDFTKTLYSMMKELKELTFSLQDKGGKSMIIENQIPEVQTTEEVTPETDFDVVANAEDTGSSTIEPVVEPNPEPIVASEQKEEKILESEDKTESEESSENQNITEEFNDNFENKDKKDAEDSDDSESDDETEEDEKKSKKAKHSLEEDDKKSFEEKFALLEEKYNELEAKCTSLEEENKELSQFKANVEDKEKDELIKSFYMLSDEDKEEVIKNKANYSLDDIEAKLSIICVHKKVNFNLNDETSNDTPATTYNLDGAGDDMLPAWLKAVEVRKNAEE